MGTALWAFQLGSSRVSHHPQLWEWGFWPLCGGSSLPYPGHSSLWDTPPAILIPHLPEDEAAEMSLLLVTNLLQDAPGSVGSWHPRHGDPKNFGNDPASGHQPPGSLQAIPGSVELIQAVYGGDNPKPNLGRFTFNRGSPGALPKSRYGKGATSRAGKSLPGPGRARWCRRDGGGAVKEPCQSSISISQRGRHLLPHARGWMLLPLLVSLLEISVPWAGDTRLWWLLWGLVGSWLGDDPGFSGGSSAPW